MTPANDQPGAHRAHIALEELKVPFEEVIIDLDTPRTPEYLKINPRGLVPALSYNGEIIIESAIVAQFLTDVYPSHLVPASNAPGGALRRARIALFVDAFSTKFNSVLFGLFSAKTEEDIQAIVEKAVAGLVKEVEPLLADASPFFGGSDKLTLAEVSAGVPCPSVVKRR
jgi:glutathione S-transferase